MRERTNIRAHHIQIERLKRFLVTNATKETPIFTIFAIFRTPVVVQKYIISKYSMSYMN